MTKEELLSLPIAQEAAFYAEFLQAREFRGIGDTREAARGRVARRVKVPESYLKRLRYEARVMRDVAGSHYRALRAAYEAAVKREADRAAIARAEREAIEHGLASFTELAAPVLGGMAADARPAPAEQED